EFYVQRRVAMNYPGLIPVMILFFLLSAAPAPAVETPKPQAVILMVNHAKTTYDNDLGHKLSQYLEKTLRKQYQLIPAKQIQPTLQKVGIIDISTAERADIIAALRNERINGQPIDIVLCIEIEPVIVQEWSSLLNSGHKATLSIPLRVIDLAGDRYLYNAKLVEQADNSSMWGGTGGRDAVFSALDKILKQINNIVKKQLPAKVIPPESPKLPVIISPHPEQS
ncbi:MAG TPA: hypothetical protein VN611_04215, partial [Patescibacteria group bacterium]|nr:hypothetical protein [Patescibacteria group bacterium]